MKIDKDVLKVKKINMILKLILSSHGLFRFLTYLSLGKQSTCGVLTNTTCENASI